MKRVNEIRPDCPKCGNVHTVKHGKQVTIKGKFQRHQCTECGATFYDKEKKEVK
ncbi:hypothetical protein LCGC14_0969240 [marine sediment metagenome]|uniref:InsA N-terminal domain-containing protein n=1 Tax=marine sediment metagenome TaxID=412755 RepID=A0A0F9NY89_9ZZZZ